MLTCQVCGKQLYKRAKVGLCKLHLAEKRKAERPKYHCMDCGGELLPGSKSAARCSACHEKNRKKEVAQREQVRREKFYKCVCEVCGKAFESKDARYRKIRFCSPRCNLLNRHATHGWTKEKVENLVLDYLKKKGSYGDRKDIYRDLHITDHVLGRFGISVPELNFVVGNRPRLASSWTKESFEDSVRGLIKEHGWLSRPEVCEKLGLDEFMGGYLFNKLDVSVPSLCEAMGLVKPHRHDRDELIGKIVEWIKSEGYYCDRAHIQKQFRLDFECTWKGLNLSAEELNAQAGMTMPKSRTTSWFEEYAYTMFCKHFGERFVDRQKQFKDCLTIKGRRAKFDFYIQHINVLVEIDGMQHYDETNKWYKQELVENDRRKDEYASRMGIPLHRVRVKNDDSSFESRLSCLISFLQEKSCNSSSDVDVIKSFELLEPPIPASTTAKGATSYATV